MSKSTQNYKHREISGISDAYTDILEFHRATGTPALDSPQIPGIERQKLRADLIVEEVVRELLPAMGFEIFDQDLYCHYDPGDVKPPDLVGIADGIVDGIVVLLGTAIEYGIPIEDIWEEIHASNMAKVSKDGKLVRRLDGKILKPEGWVPPAVDKILKNRGWDQ